MNKFLYSCAAILMCSGSAAAFAASDAQADQPARAAAPAEQAAGSGGLQDIVVTATRREQSMQKIPVTVTAMTGDMITKSGVQDVRSLTQVMPGYTGARNVTVMTPGIRGVGSSGTSVGDEANVAIYIDGVYQGDPFSTQIDLVEVERVEVLRGPQGTVFGRNATGGLINVITPKPSYDERGRLSMKFGRMRNDANEIDARAYLTGGIGDGVAGDIALMFRKSGGYIKNVLTGGSMGESQVASVRSQLLIEPTDNIEVIFMGAYVDANEDTMVQQPFEGNTAAKLMPGYIPVKGAWEGSVNTTPFNNYNRLDLSLRTKIDLGPVNLETTSAFTKTNIDQVGDSDASNLNLGYTDMQVHPEIFTHEMRLLSNTKSRLTWLAGLYFYHLDGSQPVIVATRRVFSDPTTLGTTALDPKVRTVSWAGFAEGTYELTDQLFLTGGIRYTKETRKFSQSANGRLLFPFVTSDFDKFTYRVALRYQFTDTANVYASYGTGFKSGVYNTFGTSPVAVKPENLKAGEIGFKADPQSWLRINGAAYYYDYTDMQVNGRNADNSFTLQNAASSEIYGGELEVTAVPIDDLNIRGAVAYNHARYNDFPKAQVYFPLPQGGNTVTDADVSGNSVVRAPEYTLNLGVNYGFDVGSGRGSISTNIFHSGKVYYDFRNIFQQGAYTMVSAELGWTTGNEKVRYTLFVNNLTNAKVAQQISSAALGSYIIYERPRRVGVGMDVSF